MTDKLFGDDLPKLIKELKITNKIDDKNAKKYTNSNVYRTSRFRPYTNYSKGSFLGPFSLVE